MTASFFLKEWSCCDATWHHRGLLLSFLRRHRSYFPKPEASIQLYRGCSLQRVKGVSWTSERRVAEGFARGYRGIAVPRPVIATAIVPPEAIFAGPLNDREEAEYLIDPKFVEAAVQPYVQGKPMDAAVDTAAGGGSGVML